MGSVREEDRRSAYVCVRRLDSPNSSSWAITVISPDRAEVVKFKPFTLSQASVFDYREKKNKGGMFIKCKIKELYPLFLVFSLQLDSVVKILLKMF